MSKNLGQSLQPATLLEKKGSLLFFGYLLFPLFPHLLAMK